MLRLHCRGQKAWRWKCLTLCESRRQFWTCLSGQPQSGGIPWGGRGTRSFEPLTEPAKPDDMLEWVGIFLDLRVNVTIVDTFVHCHLSLVLSRSWRHMDMRRCPPPRLLRLLEVSPPPARGTAVVRKGLVAICLNGLATLVLIVCTTIEVRARSVGDAANASRLSFTTSTSFFRTCSGICNVDTRGSASTFWSFPVCCSHLRFGCTVSGLRSTASSSSCIMFY